MKKIFIPFALYFLLFAICDAQTQWQRVIGGTNYDEARSIIQSTDGGYVIAGSTSSFGAGDTTMYIVKLNSGGSIQWARTFDIGTNGVALSITQTTDGGFAVYGSPWGGAGLMCVVKLNSSGTLQWIRTVSGGFYGFANSVQTSDGGYVLAGDSVYSDAYMYVAKLNSSGAPQWSTAIGRSGNDYATSVIQTTDGGYVVAGNTYSEGYDYDMYIVKLNASGTFQWSKIIRGENWDIANSLIQTTDGGFAVAGYTESFGANGGRFYIVKLDALGMLQWTRTVGGYGEWANCIIQTTDGGYAVAGVTWSFGAGGSDMYIVKLNSSGSLQWSKTVGGANDERAYSIIQTEDGGYVVAGYTESFGAGGKEMYIVKLDANGNTCGNSSSPQSTSGTGGIIITSTPWIIVSGIPAVTTPNPTVSSGGTITTLCVTSIKPLSNEIPASFQLYQNYPNPFNPTTKIRFDIPPSKGVRGMSVRLIIYDVLGKEVATLIPPIWESQEGLKPGTYEVIWEASNFSSGIYFYRLITNDFTETKRMVLIK